jgi:small subunit ribosomal protein S21
VTKVVLKPGEGQAELLRRFRKKVTRDRVLSDVRRKRWFVSKSELRRMAKKKAIRRANRRKYRNQGNHRGRRRR